MKRYIANKVYDTKTARLIGWDEGGEGFSHWKEYLHQKRTGEFFLYGHGGPTSRYAEPKGMSEWSGGERIRPLDAEAARKWAAEHLSAEAFDAAFGLPDESAEPEALYVQLPAQLVAAARQRAAERGCTMTALVEAALTEYLK